MIDILTEELLREKYINQRISIPKLAKEYCRSKVTIIKYLRKYNIARDYSNIITKEYLEENYINKKLSSYEIAKLLKCDSSTVRDYLRQYNIPIRSVGEAKIGIKRSPFSKEWRKNMGLARKGDKHYNWKGGVTPLRNAIYNLLEYDNWVTETFRKDNYTCQDCGKKHGYLEAHHIKSFVIIFREFLQLYSQFSPIEDKETLIRLAVSYQPFWDLTNGKTLCYACHGKTYKKNGVK